MLSPMARSALGEWLVSRETGLSSLTMAAIAMGAKRGSLHVPRDAADFGRCLGLVKKVPEVTNHFADIAWLCPLWERILRHWDELTYLHENAEFSALDRLLTELTEIG